MQIDALEAPDEVLPIAQDEPEMQPNATAHTPTEQELQAMAEEEGLPIEQ
jgi:hypothetical protein